MFGEKKLYFFIFDICTSQIQTLDVLVEGKLNSTDIGVLKNLSK